MVCKDGWPCVWITQENFDAHPDDWDDYHVHIIEEETKSK